MGDETLNIEISNRDKDFESNSDTISWFVSLPKVNYQQLKEKTIEHFGSHLKNVHCNTINKSLTIYYKKYKNFKNNVLLREVLKSNV